MYLGLQKPKWLGEIRRMERTMDFFFFRKYTGSFNFFT
jgi:hypothetical protein